MKYLYVSLATVACTALTWAAPTPKLDDDRWLQTDSTWTRTDSYGLDRNRNGRIDSEEWVQVRKSGRAGESMPWNQPARPLQQGEIHRWTVEWDETFESVTVPVKDIPKS